MGLADVAVVVAADEIHGSSEQGKFAAEDERLSALEHHGLSQAKVL